MLCLPQKSSHYSRHVIKAKVVESIFSFHKSCIKALHEEINQCLKFQINKNSNKYQRIVNIRHAGYDMNFY